MESNHADLPRRLKMTNANYNRTMNEGGEGYVRSAPRARSVDQIKSDIECTSSALANAVGYKIEMFTKCLAKLNAELAGAA